MMRKQCIWKVRNVAGFMLFVCIVISCAQVSRHEEVETGHSFDHQYVSIKKKKEKCI